MEFIVKRTPRYGTNTYLLFDREQKIAVWIDPGEEMREIEEFIEDNNLKLSKILLTHAHADHIMGIGKLQRKYNVDIECHEDEVGMLDDPFINLSAMFGNPVSFKPTKTFNDGDILEPFNLRVIHTPGHTQGSVCFLYDKIMFTGDTLFKGAVGRTDFPEGSSELLLKSILKLSRFDDDIKIYPGHDESSTLGYEKLNNSYMKGFC